MAEAAELAYAGAGLVEAARYNYRWERGLAAVGNGTAAGGSD